MLLQFKIVADGSLWSIDSDRLRYARLSRPLSEIADNPSDEPAIEEFGKLVQTNPLVKIFRLEGRTPKTDGPGAGLTSVAIIFDVVDTTLEILVEANVPITEIVCVKPIDAVRCAKLGHEPVH